MAVKTRSKPAEQKPASPPQRVEIRVGGRVLFAQDCYDVELSLENDVLKLGGALHPTMIEVAKNPPQRFEPDSDARDGEEVITKVHSGGVGKTVAPSPKET